jgi:hypothetical protein
MAGSTTCNPHFPSTSSVDQGVQFAKLTAGFHGGSRKTVRKNKRMPRNKRSKMRGGAFFTPYSEYSSAFDQVLPTELHGAARISGLDAKFVELPAVERAAGVPQAGGGRKRRTMRGGVADIAAPSMILQTPAEEAQARLNPQWYTENTVVPDFRGPIPVPGGTVPAPNPPATASPTAAPLAPKGGARKSRKGGMRKSSKSRNSSNSRKNNGKTLRSKRN